MVFTFEDGGAMVAQVLLDFVGHGFYSILNMIVILKKIKKPRM